MVAPAAPPETLAGPDYTRGLFFYRLGPTVNPIAILELPAPRALVLALLLGLNAAAAWAQAPAAASAPDAAASGPTLRPAVAAPLQAAQELARGGQHAQALAKLAEAEAVGGLTPYEVYITQRLKGPAAFGAGDPATAIVQFEQVLGSPFLGAAERPAIIETTVKLALQAKDFARARRWMETYLAEKGTSEEIRRLYPQVLSVLGDHAGVLRQLQPQLAADEAAGRTTPEATLRMVAASQSGVGDAAAYLRTLGQLAAGTGKADYWSELISRTAARDGFALERLRLDLYRLRRAAGVTLGAGELGDMAERAQQAGLPAEAQQLLDEGFGSGLLGKDKNADADRKLREQATKAATQDRQTLADSETSARNAKDGNSAFGLGLALSAAGAHERALALMAQGQAKGGLRRPEDALLHLGIASWRAGKTADALKSFNAAGAQASGDGVADLARLWALLLNSPAAKK